jgi:GNAT superfamily N-acetyltransferase
VVEHREIVALRFPGSATEPATIRAMTPLVEIRRCTSEADEQLSLDIHNTVWPHRPFSMAEARAFTSSVRDHGEFLARVDGAPAGSALVAILPQRSDVGFGIVTVLPEKRRLGAGSALHRAISEWAGDRGLGILQVPVEEDDSQSLAYAERRGFVEIERDSRMALDLTGIEEPRVVPPEGIGIVTWAERPELARGIYDVAVEAYADVPGAEAEEMEPFEDWLAHDMQGPSDKPEAIFVALAGDEVVGYAKFHLSEARPAVATHDMTGVKRAWRGRGIARALKCSQIAWAKRSGFEGIETSNEVRNDPIRRLNVRLGYKPSPGRILLKGPLARD